MQRERWQLREISLESLFDRGEIWELHINK